MLQNKCPRCRKGPLFLTANPYRLKEVFKMHEKCPQCGQRTELEPGFWYGTGYVSYVLCVVFSAINLGWFWLIFGISWHDDSICHWLIINSAILIAAMPVIIRLSRTLYLNFFVHYEKEGGN